MKDFNQTDKSYVQEFLMECLRNPALMELLKKAMENPAEFVKDHWVNQPDSE